MPQKSLKYLSICSGIEAATAAWHPLGWQPVGFSEIDSFACAVLRHHYPQVPLHGDFTALKENDYAAIDLLVGGTPCQSFSVAGLRKGLADDRGNLALEFIRLAEKSRARWVVWENVPGVLSIDGGRAFGTFLGGLAECGYGFAYRILDAQYFGVPQRRRRVFVIGYLGDWRPAAAVLFERESLRRDITPSRQARESVAGVLTSRASGGGGGPGAGTDEAVAGYLQAVAPTLDGRSGRSGENSFATSGGLVAAKLYQDSEYGVGEYDSAGSLRAGRIPEHQMVLADHVSHCLRADGFDASEDGTGRGVPLVTYDRQSSGEYKENDVASTMAARDYKSPSDLVATAFNVTFCDANGKRKDRPNGGLYVNEADASKTITSGGDLSTYIAFSAKDYGNDAAENVAPTLRAMPHDGSHQNGGGQLAVAIPLQEVGKRTGVSTDDASIGSGIGEDGDAMFTLQAAAQHAVAFAQNCRDEVRLLGGDGNVVGALPAQPGMKQQTFVAGCFKPGQSATSRSIGYEEDIAPSLEGGGGGNNKPAVLHPLDLRNALRDPGKHDAVNRQGTGVGENGAPAATISTAHTPGVISPMAVRRLTPRECERLQGFPDDYTLVPFRGKPAADGNRYKALGNSMAVPVMRWLGERIAIIEGML